MSAVIRSRAEATPDRRVRRSQAAIVTAFNRLILERGYAELTPGEVAAAANVGRSTFYEHFGGIDDLLSRALSPMLAPLANGCLERTVPDAALRTVEHLWDNRRLARALLCGDAYTVVLRSFARLFSSAVDTGKGTSRTQLEPELIGLQLAAGQLAVLGAWLSGRSGHSASEIAHALHASGRAVFVAMLETQPTSRP